MLVYLYGNEGQVALSNFNIRVAVSTNNGSSYDTGDYQTSLSQIVNGTISAIPQSGYPAIATNCTGYLNTQSVFLTVSQGLYDYGRGIVYGSNIDVVVNGVGGVGTFKNTGTIHYGNSFITNVRVSLEGQTNGLGGQFRYAVENLTFA